MIKLLRLLKPYRLPVIFALMLVFIQSLAELYLPTLMADIVDTGIVQGDTDYILRVGGLMLLVAAGGTLCSVGASFLSAKVSVGFGSMLRQKVFSHVEKFSLQEFDQIGTASLITRTTNDINQIQHVLTVMFRMLVSAPMMCIGGIIMAVSRDAKLSLIFLVAIPIVSGIILLIIRHSIPLFKAMQTKIDKLNLVLRENLTGIRVIRAFNRLDHERKRFDLANCDLRDTAIRVNQIMAALMPSMMLMLNLSIVATLWFGAVRIDQGNLQLGNLMAFTQYAMQILFSLVMLSMMFVMIPRASASAVRINEVLAVVPQITDAGQVNHTGSKRASVEFKNVTFSYPGAEKPALRNISFTAGPGQVTAIIGGTGSGKSTLINLIPRFYDVDSGCILVDGVDVRKLPQKVLRAKIGYVPQRALLFSGTVADNIRFGKETATLDEVRHAATVAQAGEFIDVMEQGYHSEIAQGGTNISGGQRQRLAIARALVRKPEIYLFDDSFSALDFKTDAQLRAALKQQIANATVIIVAQRVSTVMDADQIIVLDQGQMAGIGSHKQLLNTCQVYREIVASQLAKEEIA